MRWRLVLLLLLVAGLLLGLTPRRLPLGPLYAPAPLVVHHPHARGLVSWWRVAAPWYGGPVWYDLAGRSDGVLTSMGSGTGWGTAPASSSQGAMQCDGAGASVEMGNATSLVLLGPLTVLVWTLPTTVDFTGVGGAGLLTVGQSGAPELPYGLLIGRTTVGEFAMRWGDTNLPLSSGAGLSAGVPHYLGATRSGASGSWTLTYFVDGVQISQTTGIATDPVSVDASGEVALCRRAGGTSYYQGTLNDVMLWQRALTATEMGSVVRELQAGAPTLLRRQRDLAPLAGGLGVVPRRGMFLPFMNKRGR